MLLNNFFAKRLVTAANPTSIELHYAKLEDGTSRLIGIDASKKFIASLRDYKFEKVVAWWRPFSSRKALQEELKRLLQFYKISNLSAITKDKNVLRLRKEAPSDAISLEFYAIKAGGSLWGLGERLWAVAIGKGINLKGEKYTKTVSSWRKIKSKAEGASLVNKIKKDARFTVTNYKEVIEQLGATPTPTEKVKQPSKGTSSDLASILLKKKEQEKRIPKLDKQIASSGIKNKRILRELGAFVPLIAKVPLTIENIVYYPPVGLTKGSFAAVHFDVTSSDVIEAFKALLVKEFGAVAGNRNKIDFNYVLVHPGVSALTLTNPAATKKTVTESLKESPPPFSQEARVTTVNDFLSSAVPHKPNIVGVIKYLVKPYLDAGFSLDIEQTKKGSPNLANGHFLFAFKHPNDFLSNEKIKEIADRASRVHGPQGVYMGLEFAYIESFSNVYLKISVPPAVFKSDVLGIGRTEEVSDEDVLPDLNYLQNVLKNNEIKTSGLEIYDIIANSGFTINRKHVYEKTSKTTGETVATLYLVAPTESVREKIRLAYQDLLALIPNSRVSPVGELVGIYKGLDVKVFLSANDRCKIRLIAPERKEEFTSEIPVGEQVEEPVVVSKLSPKDQFDLVKSKVSNQKIKEDGLNLLKAFLKNGFTLEGTNSSIGIKESTIVEKVDEKRGLIVTIYLDKPAEQADLNIGKTRELLLRVASNTKEVGSILSGSYRNIKFRAVLSTTMRCYLQLNIPKVENAPSSNYISRIKEKVSNPTAQRVAINLATSLLKDPLITLDSNDDAITSMPVGPFDSNALVKLRFRAQQEDALDKAFLKIEYGPYRLSETADARFIKKDEQIGVLSIRTKI